MATLTVQAITSTGIAPVFTAVNSPDQFAPGEDLILHVKNGSGASINVTIADAGTTQAGNASVNQVVAVPAGAEREVAVSQFSVNPNTGFIVVTYSATASVTAALKTR